MPADAIPSANSVAEYLRLEAGRLMEDTSVEFALATPSEEGERRAHLDRLRLAANDIATLAMAAEVLDRRGSLS